MFPCTIPVSIPRSWPEFRMCPAPREFRAAVFIVSNLWNDQPAFMLFCHTRKPWKLTIINVARTFIGEVIEAGCTMTENEVANLMFLCECKLMQECQAVRDVFMRILVPRFITMPSSET